jgi:hypothetical protein
METKHAREQLRKIKFSDALQRVNPSLPAGGAE